MTESFPCLPETTTTVLIRYARIQKCEEKKKIVKDKKQNSGSEWKKKYNLKQFLNLGTNDVDTK